MGDDLEPALVEDQRVVPAAVGGLPHLHDAHEEVHLPVVPPEVEVEDAIGQEVLPVMAELVGILLHLRDEERRDLEFPEPLEEPEQVVAGDWSGMYPVNGREM